ncbi:hypothetical protein [Endozoicomonas atrinae]|nr:hypothetical protein [Endozoicomonas atrinae]
MSVLKPQVIVYIEHVPLARWDYVLMLICNDTRSVDGVTVIVFYHTD